MKKSLICLAVTLVVVGWRGTMSTASAAIVYSTIGSASSYDALHGHTWLGYSPPLYDWAAAIPFVPASDYSLTTIEIGLGWYNGVNGADVWLMSDNAGQPGTIMESFQVTNIPYFDALHGTMSMPLVELGSVLQPTLQAATQYWVGASGVNTGPLADVLWPLISPQSSLMRATINYLDASPSWSVTTWDWYVPALRVNGDAIPAIPIPGAIGLVATALLTAAPLRRRFRRSN